MPSLASAAALYCAMRLALSEPANRDGILVVISSTWARTRSADTSSKTLVTIIPLQIIRRRSGISAGKMARVNGCAGRNGSMIWRQLPAVTVTLAHFD
jgi:hypothetical protein